eukprot:1157241-Pelagomonas_calceolata.AAC.1
MKRRHSRYADANSNGDMAGGRQLRRPTQAQDVGTKPGPWITIGSLAQSRAKAPGAKPEPDRRQPRKIFGQKD